MLAKENENLESTSEAWQESNPVLGAQPRVNSQGRHPANQ